MNGETWTEYAVMRSRNLVLDGLIWRDRNKAREMAAHVGGTVVGRTVTATPWLPVQDQP